MKRSFRLDNMCCATCIDKIHQGVEKLDGVNEVTSSFMTTRITVIAEDDKMEEIIEKMKVIVKKVDCDIVMRRA